jgi:hypothetical protein
MVRQESDPAHRNEEKVFLLALGPLNPDLHMFKRVGSGSDLFLGHKMLSSWQNLVYFSVTFFFFLKEM